MLLHWMQQTSNTGQQEKKSLGGYRKVLDRLQVVGQYEGLWAVSYHSYESSIIWQSDHFDPLELVGGKCLLCPMDDKRDKNNMIGLLSRDTQRVGEQTQKKLSVVLVVDGVRRPALKRKEILYFVTRHIDSEGGIQCTLGQTQKKKTLYHLTFTQNHGKVNECLGTTK